MTRRAALVLALAAACGGGGWPSVISQAQVPSADGAPSVKKVTDLGDLASIPLSGPIPKAGIDGKFVVGEYVLIEGENIGKQPTVLIGGRPVERLARASGGGVLAQIPTGITPGKVTVEVSTPSGRGTRDIEVARLALVSQRDAGVVHVVDVTGQAAARGKVDAPGARAVRFSADGSIGYVASDGNDEEGGRLHVVQMAAPGGPAVGFSTKTVPRVVALASSQTKLLAVVGDKHLHLFLLEDSRHPSPYDQWPLPDEVVRGGVLAADLTADGKVLVVLVAEGNMLHAIDLADPRAPRLSSSVELFPEVRSSIVRDVRVNGAGDTAWVVAGDTARSIAAGKQPTRLVTVALRGVDAGQPTLEVGRAAGVAGATAPVRLAVPRSLGMAAGTSVRDAAAEVPIFVSAVAPQLVEGRDPAEVMKEIAEPAMMVRTDPEGRGGPLFGAAGVLAGADLSPDAAFLLVAGGRAAAGGWEAGVTSYTLAGGGPAVFLPLGPLDAAAALKPPFTFADVAVQP
jgi:hypothetical protein